MNKNSCAIFVLFVASFLSACGGGGGGGSSNSSAPPVSTQPSIQIQSSRALSQHYVEVGFNQALTQEQLDAIKFTIVSDSGQALAVKNISLTNQGSGAIVETEAQDPVLYTLMMTTATVGTASAQRVQAASAQRVKIAGLSTTIASASSFIGSSGSEPIVLTVTALSNTSVLVTMNKTMDKVSAEKISAYRILAPNYKTPNKDEGRIQVNTATLGADARLITLTTSPMNDIEYQLVITNIMSSVSALIHPDRNGGSFFGIAQKDTTKPRLMTVASTSQTSVLATFSEPLSDDAAAPTRFQLCSIAFDSTGACPLANRLNVIASQLTSMNTQVVLTTAPQNSGLNYFLSVTGITDRATPAPGNAIDPLTVAQFTGSGSGAPKIASVLATDNTHLLVTFTERMGTDALNKSNYRIENPPLDIINAVAGSDAWHVILSTTPQERRDYQLNAADVHSAEGTLIANASPIASFVGFDSKDTQKPRLLAAVAETSNSTRLYFSEPLDSNAATPTFYSITFCPEGQTCTASTLSQLPVLSAQLAESDTQVVLTTKNIAPRVEHQVLVSEFVTDKALPLPHNATDASFATGTFGLLLADKTAPGLANMTITSATSITLTFSEVLSLSAANPLFYNLCSEPFTNGTCATNKKIQVLGAVLNPSSTQVTLTTAPLAAGSQYYVLVTPGITDTSGNVISSNGNAGNVSYAGTTSVADPSKLPQVVGAISTSNTTVTLSFSSVMGDSALLPLNYLFTQENVNGEVGTVFTMAVSWFDDSHTSVSITTTAQNEVTYRVTVVNVKDQLGNPLDTRKLTLGSDFNPSSAVFAGSAPVAQNLQLTATNWQWLDNNDDGEKGVGDAYIINGNSLVLTDKNLDGAVDNWQDTNNNGAIDAGDFISGLTDSDSDGLADNEELRGTTVEITMVGGQKTIRQVTSDPTQADTDKDGLTDQEEWAFGSDPRSADTDSDGINDYVEWNVVYSNPSDQDSDDDTLPDGLEHSFFHTSPILADTDGDQFGDAVELLSLNRDPKVADLPEIAIHVDGVNLHIDERYTYVDSKGETVSSESSTNTSLSSDENTSFANSVSTMDETTGGFSVGVGAGLRDAQTEATAALTAIAGRAFLEVNAEGHFDRTTGTTIQIDNSSSRDSQQALENSLTKANDASKGSEVTRELIGARISANISVENTGNVALKVKNLQVSVEQIDPQNPNKLLPIATLVAESGQITGNDVEINLGPFDKNKGPFIFSNNNLYPGLVETLMRNPKSLVFKVVNYDIADEYDRNFAFASQLARDRTAGITFDFGELGSEAHYVATNGIVSNGTYLGGFDAVGKPLGLPLGYLLENVLGIPKHATDHDYIDAGVDGVMATSPAGDDTLQTLNGNPAITTGANGILDTTPAGDDRLRNDAIKTGIIAGADKRVDSIAQGDDLQLVPFGSTGVAPKTLVIDPGSNGILESGRSGDDVQEFISGYQVQTTCSIASSKKALVGVFCSATQNGCSCDGPKGLVRVNTLRNGDFANTWFVRFSGDAPAAVDFDKIQVKPGQDIRLAFLQDLDKDGLFANEEYLYGSTDSSVNRYDNSQFSPVVVDHHYRAKTLSELAAASTSPDIFADSMDTDRDGVSDFAEAKLGWLISRNGELKRVYSSPALADSDNDGLWDIQEQDLREFCAANDPRSDALCRPIHVAKTEATGIIVGKNGRLDTLKAGDDEYALFIPKNSDGNLAVPDLDDRFNRGLMYATVAILAGPNGVVDTNVAADDEYSNASITLPATDPMLSDTDLDRVSDGDELFGFAAGMSIVEGAEPACNNIGTPAAPNCSPAIHWGFANTRAQGDDVQRIFPGNRTNVGDVIVSAGANGILETTPEGDDVNVSTSYVAAGADRILNCQATSQADNRTVFGATDSFRLDPYAPAIWNVNGNPQVADPTCYVDSLSKDVAGKDVNLYGRVVTTDPLRRDSENDGIPDGFEVAIGADPTVFDGDNFRDSDFDGLSNTQEARGWVVAVNGGVGRLLRSNGALADSDYDGLPDYVERDIGTNPNLKDTDNDGLDDYAEFRSVIRMSENGMTMLYSVTDYDYMPNVFTGFHLVVNPVAYNTDPTLNDSDADGLGDFQELVTGYRINITGQSILGPVILTNPNNADTDGDGLTDRQEFNGASGANGITYVTNAANADTDADGSSDNDELNNGLTNPLVADVLVNVSYDSLYLADLNGCTATATAQPCPTKTNVLWWLYATGNDGQSNSQRLLSSSDEFAYTPDGSVRPLSGGHTSLISEADALNGVPPADQPGGYVNNALRMSAKYCPTGLRLANMWLDETNCTPFFDVKPGDRGYTATPNANYGDPGGVLIYSDLFIVEWVGEIYVPQDGDYEFFGLANDGIRIFIDGKPDSVLQYPVSNDWSNGKGVVTLKAGWHPFKTSMYEISQYANVNVWWRPVSLVNPVTLVSEPVVNPQFVELATTSVRHKLGDGAYSCVALERDTNASSYISLTRLVDLDDSYKPAATLSPNSTYYGSTLGSELKIFRAVVDEDPQGARYYVNSSPTVQSNGQVVSTKDRINTAMDLAASRNIIANLVQADTNFASTLVSAQLKVNATNGDINFGRQYYDLSADGKKLYRQLKSSAGRFGQQSFVLRENETMQLSGTLMKIDDLTKLDACPIGASGVVSQFGSSCTKRFSRTLSYADVKQTRNMEFTLQDMKTQTYTTNTAGGCEMDLTTTVRAQ